jgi:putative spermidine/putrescine transport system substrate-binding protein
MSHLDRRTFLRLAATLTPACLASAAFTRPALAQALTTIRVTHFGGPYGALKDLVGAPFENEKLGRVVYETEGSGAVLLGKLQAQRDNPPFNVFMMNRSFSTRAANAGLISTLSADEVPALREVHKEALLKNGSGVGMVYDSFDVMYDTTKVSAPITSWLDLWRPDLKGKLVLPSSALGGTILFVVISVARSLGGGERDVEGAFKKLKELKPNVRLFYSDPNQATQLIERGEVAAAAQYSIRIGHVMKGNPNVARATPKEGVIAVPYDLCVTKASPNQDVSKRYINFALSPKIQEALAANLLATPVHRAVKVPPAVQRLVMTDASKLVFIDEDYVAAQQKEWVDRWTREIQS